MKLLRVGKAGKEKPAILDGENNYRDLSNFIHDLNPENLNFETLNKIKEIKIQDLPIISKDHRIGPCINNPSKFIGIG